MNTITLSIGACVRHAAFHRPVVAGPTGSLLSAVVSHIAHYPIRLRGTFCGSLAHADPASEWCLTAVTLGAEIVAASSRGLRVIAADDYFEGMMMTALAEDELLLEVHVPLLAPDTRFGFYEFSRRAGDFAIAMALATFRLADGRIVEPRVGVGGAEPKPRRIAQAEQVTAALDGLASRLGSFNSLALYQLERIRVKYRPAGFVCSIPGVRNLFAKSCFPLRTTTELLPQSIRTATTSTPKPSPRDQLVISSRYPSESR